MKGMKLFGLSILLAASMVVYADEDLASGNPISIPGPTELPYYCGDMGVGYQGYGPYDYTNYDDYTTKLDLVESAHFTREVETLVAGNSTWLIEDLDYTIRVFPNHHRALVSVSKFEFQASEEARKVMKAKNIEIECYFILATNFRPMDGMVRLIYGTYLHRKGIAERRKELLERAEMQYNYALQLIPSSAEVHYNLGLFYYDTNKMNLAVKHGHKAYELGFYLDGLKDKLKKKGVWDKTVSQY